MIYPKLKNTPIKEIIFSISYEEIVDKNCFQKFIDLKEVSARFNDIKPSVILEFTNQGLKQSTDNNNFHLRNKTEVLQLRKGALSYHYLGGYKNYSEILDSIVNLWILFDSVTKDDLTINSVSIRYINVIQIDEDNPPSRLVQLYPKQSSDRNIINFQNSVNFNYSKFPDYNINVVSTKPKQDIVLLDITVSNKLTNPSPFKENEELFDVFKPLQEIKNKVFFDSITAKALIKYI
ncbi:TIGR04255 family protein [Flavobacterium yafengii]|uniref:TIGR04255 family protein n=1 Tax=Flavobacterium yafengii TaxID=3041253 RepID=UPI0024A7F1E7|nr:TIGR04255 family protein [Flavobacterium yafengii]MDI6045655.1 TIGR04255 family protein [Flavobacterium yafengii]